MTTPKNTAGEYPEWVRSLSEYETLERAVIAFDAATTDSDREAAFHRWEDAQETLDRTVSALRTWWQASLR